MASAESSVVETYGAAHWPADSDFDQLELALTNLALLTELVKVRNADRLANPPKGSTHPHKRLTLG